MHQPGHARGWTLCLVLALVSLIVLAAGCSSSEKMQSFVDGYLRVMQDLEADPQAASTSQEASQKYVASGYTDMESAGNARQSYLQTVKKDQAGLSELGKIQAPDDQAADMKQKLSAGISDIVTGNTLFAANLEKAIEQTVEQRAAQAQDMSQPVGYYAQGMSKIVESLEALKKYVKDNGLDGSATVEKWYSRTKSDLEAAQQYLQQLNPQQNQ